MSVVIAHVLFEYSHNSIGTYGVDVFFVISGFVIFLSLDKNPEKFLLKRLIRIVPLYWTITLILFGAILGAPHLFKSLSADPETLITSLFFIPHYTSLTLYDPILAVGWTLNYEIYFYLMVQCAILINRKHIFYTSIFLISLIPIASLFINFPMSIKFYADPIVFEFLLGMLLYKIYKSQTLKQMPGSLPLFIIALITLPLLQIYLQNAPRFLTFGLCSFILVYLGLSLNNKISFPKWVLLLGDASYALYLTHSIVIRGVHMILPDFIHQNLAQALSLTIIIALLISVGVFKFYETPMKKLFYQWFTGSHKNKTALLHANYIQKQAAKTGFDWPDADPVLDKLHEEIEEYKQAIANQDNENLFEEVGDLLFTLVNLARKHNIDPEEALRCANLKFETRFRKIENEIKPEDTLAILEEKWQRAKQ